MKRIDFDDYHDIAADGLSGSDCFQNFEALTNCHCDELRRRITQLENDIVTMREKDPEKAALRAEIEDYGGDMAMIDAMTGRRDEETSVYAVKRVMDEFEKRIAELEKEVEYKTGQVAYWQDAFKTEHDLNLSREFRKEAEDE